MATFKQTGMRYCQHREGDDRLGDIVFYSFATSPNIKPFKFILP